MSTVEAQSLESFQIRPQPVLSRFVLVLISVTGTLIQTGALRCFLSTLGFPAIISPFEWQVLLTRSHFAK